MDELQAAPGGTTDPFEDPGLYDYANWADGSSAWRN